MVHTGWVGPRICSPIINGLGRASPFDTSNYTLCQLLLSFSIFRKPKFVFFKESLFVCFFLKESLFLFILKFKQNFVTYNNDSMNIVKILYIR